MEKRWALQCTRIQGAYFRHDFTPATFRLDTVTCSQPVANTIPKKRSAQFRFKRGTPHLAGTRRKMPVHTHSGEALLERRGVLSSHRR